MLPIAHTNLCRVMKKESQKGLHVHWGHTFSFPEILILLFNNDHRRANPDKLNNFRT